jgi:hypothetical protein
MAELDMRKSTTWISSSKRVNTGVLQFGNDWPGIFVRGDEAMRLAAMCDQLSKSTDQEWFKDRSVQQLQRLAELFRSCSMREPA